MPVMPMVPGLRVHDPRHDHAYLGRCVELAGALTATLGEFPNKILVGPADNVGFYIIES